MVDAEHGGPQGGDAGVVAAGLVPVAQLVRHRGQLEGERQHQRIGRRPEPLTCGERLLQHAPGGTRVVRLPVQAGQQVRGAQHIRVVLAVRRSGGADGVVEQSTGGMEIARGAQG